MMYVLNGIHGAVNSSRTIMLYTFRQGDLPKLDLTVDRGTAFNTWKSQWQAYLSLSGLENQASSSTHTVLLSRDCHDREQPGADRGTTK